VGALAAALVAVGATPLEAASSPKFTLASTAFADDGTIPVEHSCVGEGVSPPLAWKGVPKGTKELALIVDDPDAPVGTFTHWVLADITPSTTSIAQGGTPPGAFVGSAGTGRPGYVPMCPPPGPAHHYVFTLYALKKKVEPPPGADATALRTAMKGKVSKRAELVGLFARPES
jgi:Raf kinase inhibitor-like YbhB/YbcL family protein